MTKKDYKKIAKALALVEPDETDTASKHRYWRSIVNSLASELEKDDKAFKKDAFIAACKFENLTKI